MSEDFVKWIKFTTSSLNIWLQNWLKIDKKNGLKVD